MKKVNSKAILVMFFAALFAATVPAMPDQKGEMVWKLIEVYGDRVSADSKAYIKFSAKNDRFEGHTGCNQVSGTALLRFPRFDLIKIGSTKMACADPTAAKVERRFLEALDEARRTSISGKAREPILWLIAGPRIIMKFASVKVDSDEPQKPGLEDKKWMLTEIAGKQVSKAAGSAFLNFDSEKKSAGGNTNCNVFGGSYETTGSKISITEVMSTMRACEEGDRMAVERGFLDGLQKADRYAVEKGKLILYRDKQRLLTFTAQDK